MPSSIASTTTCGSNTYTADSLRVPTNDFEAAVEFYGTTLGLPCSVEMPERHYAELLGELNPALRVPTLALDDGLPPWRGRGPSRLARRAAAARSQAVRRLRPGRARRGRA